MFKKRYLCTLMAQGNKEMLKKQTGENMPKGHRSQPKELSMAKAKTTGATK